MPSNSSSAGRKFGRVSSSSPYGHKGKKKYKNKIIVTMHGTKIHRICHLSSNDMMGITNIRWNVSYKLRIVKCDLNWNCYWHIRQIFYNPSYQVYEETWRKFVWFCIIIIYARWICRKKNPKTNLFFCNFKKKRVQWGVFFFLIPTKKSVTYARKTQFSLCCINCS